MFPKYGLLMFLENFVMFLLQPKIKVLTILCFPVQTLRENSVSKVTGQNTLMQLDRRIAWSSISLEGINQWNLNIWQVTLIEKMYQILAAVKRLIVPLSDNT